MNLPRANILISNFIKKKPIYIKHTCTHVNEAIDLSQIYILKIRKRKEEQGNDFTTTTTYLS